VDGLRARDVLGGQYVHAPVSTVRVASAGQYDLVLVAVRADQLKAACAQLTGLTGSPAVVLFGNKTGGMSMAGSGVVGDVRQGFPGIGGVLRDGVAEYVRVPQQPTALEAGSDPRLAELEQTLSSRGFPVQRVTDMDGWLLYHAAFVACVAAALFRCGTDPKRLAADPPTLSLMCAAGNRGVRRVAPGRPGRAAAQPGRAAQSDAETGSGPVLGPAHALAHGRAVLCRALPAWRTGNARARRSGRRPARRFAAD
jgi:ketopantoate reductase